MNHAEHRLIELTAGGLNWHVLPEWRDLLLNGNGLRLPEWLNAGQARVVKHGPHRTVYRVRLSDVDFHLKHYRLADNRSWLRQLVRPSKARVEFTRALAIAARDVPTVLPLALGEPVPGAGPGESFLVTRSVDGAEPLSTFLEATLPGLHPLRQARLRQRLATALGQLVARLHDAGIRHDDLHAANLLLHLDPRDQPELYLIDLHDVRLGPPLVWPARRENLVVLNRWFVVRASRSDRLRFWHAYALARDGSAHVGPEAARRARDLEDRTWQSNLDFWRNRDRRCLVTNRYYHRLRAPGVVGVAVRDVDSTSIAGLLVDPDAPFRQPGATVLKDSPSSTVVEMDLTVAGVARRVICKRFRVTSRLEPWRNLLRRSPALRSWVFGHGLRERCLPSARPLVVLHRRRRGLLYEGYLITQKLPDAQTLHAAMASLTRLPKDEQRVRLRAGIDQLARLVRALHDRQLSHRDLKATNILVSGGGLWLIDLVGLRCCRRLSSSRRIQNLARLNASFWRNPHVSRTDKLRFLRMYMRWGLLGRTGWKELWRDITRATELKVARNAKNGRPLA